MEEYFGVYENSFLTLSFRCSDIVWLAAAAGAGVPVGLPGARAHQLGHVDPGAAVGEHHGQQDEAVRRADQHDPQVHSETRRRDMATLTEWQLLLPEVEY